MNDREGENVPPSLELHSRLNKVYNYFICCKFES